MSNNLSILVNLNMCGSLVLAMNVNMQVEECPSVEGLLYDRYSSDCTRSAD